MQQKGIRVPIKPSTCSLLALGILVYSHVKELTDPMEDASLVVEGFAALSSTLFTGAQGSEVLNSLGDVLAKQTKDDTTRGPTFDFDIKENLVGNSLPTSKEGKDMSIDEKLLLTAVRDSGHNRFASPRSYT